MSYRTRSTCGYLCSYIAKDILCKVLVMVPCGCPWSHSLSLRTAFSAGFFSFRNSVTLTLQAIPSRYMLIVKLFFFLCHYLFSLFTPTRT